MVSHSNGHGCMLLYALLHLFGYGVSIDDLRAFRVGLERWLPYLTRLIQSATLAT